MVYRSSHLENICSVSGGVLSASHLLTWSVLTSLVHRGGRQGWGPVLSWPQHPRTPSGRHSGSGRWRVSRAFPSPDKPECPSRDEPTVQPSDLPECQSQPRGPCSGLPSPGRRSTMAVRRAPPALLSSCCLWVTLSWWIWRQLGSSHVFSGSLESNAALW